MKSVHFSLYLAFEITLKQHKTFSNQSQTDTCRNNKCLSLDFDGRQTSAISTGKTFAVPLDLFVEFIRSREINPSAIILPKRTFNDGC